MWNCDFFDLCIAAINGHYGECNLLIEPALAAASRIQPEDAIHHLLGVFMRMTVDHHIRIVQVFEHKFLVMNHKEPAFLNLKGQAFRYVLCPFFIVIAANDVDRRDFLQSVNDFRFVGNRSTTAVKQKQSWSQTRLQQTSNFLFANVRQLVRPRKQII